MKLRTDRDLLAHTVGWVARRLPTRPPVPVLASIRLDVDDDGRLTVSGFDYETSTVGTVNVEAADPGSVLVSGRLLADITKNLPDQPVDLTVDGTRVVLTCGSTRFTLPTLPIEDYPALPNQPPRAGLIPAAEWADAVRQVTVAAARDHTLQTITGVSVAASGDTLTLAATDRYRLAVRTLPWQPDTDVDVSVLLPAQVVADAAKTMTTGEHVELRLDTDSNRVAGLAGGGRQVVTRLLDGDFPNYERLFPTEFGHHVTVQVEALADAVRRAALVAERNTPVRLSITQGRITVEAGAGDEAQAVETVPAELDGGDIAIGFNPGYLLDALGVLDTDTVQLAAATPAKPVVLTLRPVDGGDGRHYRHMLMPIRLHE